jgi:hypothetical protein
VAAGVFSGSLANEGELISLRGPLGELLQSFTYGDSNVAGWPADADGDGRSLEYVGPFDHDPANPGSIVGDPYDEPANWRASLLDGGSPGDDGNLTPIAGDYDASGEVDSLDYNKWRADFGMAVTPGSGADGNANGVVDASDFTVWRDNFGAQAPGAGAGGGAAVARLDAVEANDDGTVVIQNQSAMAFDLAIVSSSSAAEQSSFQQLDTQSSKVDANLLLCRSRQHELEEIAASVSQDGTEAVDPAAIWEDDAWLVRLGRGV